MGVSATTVPRLLEFLACSLLWAAVVFGPSVSSSGWFEIHTRGSSLRTVDTWALAMANRSCRQAAKAGRPHTRGRDRE